jgi:electron transfer flavoprotein beta subunit
VPPGGTVAVDRLTDDGVLTEHVALPALVTVSSEIGDLGPVDFRGISAAKKKPIRVVEVADIEPASGPYLLALDRPRIEKHCEMISAETARQAGALLAKRLR